MVVKDKIALGFSFVALSLSIGSTILGETRAAVERERSVKAELSDTLSRVMALSKENATLMRDYMFDEENQGYYSLQSSNISQESTFLIQKAMYLATEIPDLVTPVELNTIATSNAQAGDLPNAEKYYLLAIKKSRDPYYTTLAIRSYASFLFPQRRFSEGRDQFKLALTLLAGGDNFVRGINGFTYQMWASNELSVANNRNRAIDLFREARNEFIGIDNVQWKNNLLRGLDSAVRAASNGDMDLASLAQGD
jgi:hypothetical protein